MEGSEEEDEESEGFNIRDLRAEQAGYNTPCTCYMDMPAFSVILFMYTYVGQVFLFGR